MDAKIQKGFLRLSLDVTSWPPEWSLLAVGEGG